MTTASVARPTSPGLPRWLRFAGWLTVGHWYILGGFLLAAVIVVTVILALVSRTMTPTISALQFVQAAAPWFPFGVAIHFAVNWLGPQVSAGMTRRSFVRASVVAALAVAATAAVALMVLLRIEDAVYERLGWVAAPDGLRVAPVGAPIGPYFWGLFLLIAAGGLAGLVVGLTYARLGPVATFLLPVTLLPLPAMVALALDPMTMFTPTLISVDDGLYRPMDFGLGGLASPVLGVAVLAVTILAVHLLARRIPIRSPRA